MRALVSSGVLVACCIVAAAAQQPAERPADAQQPPVPPVFRTGVGLVRVDVTVSDKTDHPVTDLTAADFEVREDGVAQEIQTLQFVRLTGRPPAGDDASLDIRSPEHAAQEAARDDVRLLVLFLDDYHLQRGPAHDVRLRELLRRFVSAEMKPLDLFAVMEPLTPITHLGLTRDKQEVLDRIARFEGRLNWFFPRSPLEEGQMYLRPGDRTRIRTEISISALKSLVDYLGTLKDGRKSVLYVSESPALLGPDGSRHYDAVRDAVTAANRGNVVIHTLDPRDLMSSGFANDMNSALALDTGGRALGRSNDFSRGLRAVIADASAYYLLGYVPARPPNDGKFHKIDVKVKRSGARVLARRGYWAASAEESKPRPAAPTAPADVTAAIGTLADPPRGRLVDWWLGVERGRAGGAAVAFSWERGTTEAAAEVAQMRLAVVDGGEDHLVPADPGRARGPWQVRATLPARPITLKVTAEDREGHALESWTQNIDPALPASGLAIDTPRLVVAQGVPATATADTPAAARRRFRRTERVSLIARVHGFSAGAPQVDVELLNRHGTKLVSLAPATVKDGDVSVDLPLANLAQAEYVVRLTARDGEASVSDAVSFAIVP
jgi:VWFA-related protein